MLNDYNEVRMNKPNLHLLRLYGIGTIQCIEVEQQQTGTDSTATYVKIKGVNGECRGKWKTYEPYIDVKVRYNSIATIKHGYIAELAKWKLYQEENERELAEYERLKAKFG